MSHRRLLWVIVALALAGCRKERPAEPVDAGAHVAAVPADAGKPRPVKTREESGPAAYTWLSRAGEGGCTWHWLDPVAKDRRVVMEVPRACGDLRLAWSREGDRALVFDPSSRRAWEKDLVSGEVRPLTLPALPTPRSAPVADLAYGPEGELVALVELRESELQRETTDAGEARWVFLDQHIPVPEVADGLPGLAAAFRLEGERWRLVEVVPTTFEWDLALGVDALKINRELGPRSSRALSVSGRPAAENVPPTSPIFDALSSSADLSAESLELGGGWVRLTDAPVSTYVYEEAAEFSIPTALIRFVGDGGTPVAPGGLELDGPVPTRYQLRGPYLLMAAPWGEPTEDLYLLDLRTQQVISRTPETWQGMFWPLKAAAPAGT